MSWFSVPKPIFDVITLNFKGKNVVQSSTKFVIDPNVYIWIFSGDLKKGQFEFNLT